MGGNLIQSILNGMPIGIIEVNQQGSWKNTLDKMQMIVYNHKILLRNEQLFIAKLLSRLPYFLI